MACVNRLPEGTDRILIGVTPEHAISGEIMWESGPGSSTGLKAPASVPVLFLMQVEV